MKRVSAVLIILAVVAGCATTDPVTLRIKSQPSQAFVLRSEEKAGPWEAYEKKDGHHVTPSESTIKSNEFFWIMLQKDDYRDTVPYFIRPQEGEDVLEPPVFVLEPVNDDGETAMVYIKTPDEDGYEVLVSKSMDGDYAPWDRAIGKARTPARGRVPVGDGFWVRVRKGRKRMGPEYVYVEAAEPSIHVTFADKEAKQALLTITSTPTHATVLVSNEEHGQYRPWPPEESLQATPLEVQVNVGQTFWVKLRKDGYWTTEPVLISVETQRPVVRDFALIEMVEPDVPERDTEGQLVDQEPAADTGVVANGYAPVHATAGQARNDAILDALGVAILQQYGGAVSSLSLSENYVLAKRQVEAVAKGSFVSYDVLEEGQADGIYHVQLRVKFREDILKGIRGENITFYVGGIEKVAFQGEAFDSTEAREALADALMDAGMAVRIAESSDRSADAVAGQAAEAQTDVAIWLHALCEPFDSFGQFHSYTAALDYKMLIPLGADVIATGRLEGRNEERKLDERDAAIAALRDVAVQAAEEMLAKLAARYDRAGAHRVYVTGLSGEVEAQTIADELATVAGVRSARLLDFEGAIAEIGLFVSPDTRPRLGHAVQSLRNADLTVVEGDLYTTVAKVR